MEFYRTSNIQYTPAGSAWGPPTSTLNFCEEDYEHTRYIAELFNTLTNLTYILLALHGLYRTTHLYPFTHLPPHFPYYSLLLLGLASAAFHCTLQYPFQLCDESSMLIATFIVFYRLLCFSQTRYSPRQLQIGSGVVLVVVAVAQWMLRESWAQQVVFVGMVYWLWKSLFDVVSRIPDQDLKRKMWWTAASGIALFLIGHACWFTDFHACDTLRSTRQSISHTLHPLAGGILELHGYWHILTGIGVYIHMNLVECLRYTSLASSGQDTSKPGFGSARPIVKSDGRWPFMVYLAKDEEVVGGKKER